MSSIEPTASPIHAVGTTMETLAAGRHKLLVIIDAVVGADDRPPGFDGSIGVVIKDSVDVECWYGRFSKTKKLEVRFAPGLPLGINVLVILGPKGAELALRGEDPRTDAVIVGSGLVLDRFITRYCAKPEAHGLAVEIGS